MVELNGRGNAVKLTLLTAAVGAGWSGTASAAPTMFTPVSFTGNVASSQSFDVDGNGTNDFTIGSDGSGNIYLSAPSATNTIGGFAGQLDSYSSQSGFRPATQLKANSTGGLRENFVGAGFNGGTPSSSFALNTPSFAEVGLNSTYLNGSVTNATLGYFLATRTASGIGSDQVNTITISDFGLAGAVPEPASWMMMILGAGGIGTLRRRRRAAFAI